MDELGGFSKALDLLRVKAGLRPGGRVELVEYPPRKALLELLLSRANLRGLFLPLAVDRVVDQWRRIESISSSPLMARMPYSFTFR